MGAALNVHEGPQGISFRYGNLTPLVNGMIVSNEPGYYEDHVFGIRIEVCTRSVVCFSLSFSPYNGESKVAIAIKNYDIRKSRFIRILSSNKLLEILSCKNILVMNSFL